MPQTVKDSMMSRISKATAKAAKGSARVALSHIANRVNKDTQAKSPNKKKNFPDLNKDGKITQADVLMGRGVIGSPKKLKMDKEKRGGRIEKRYAIENSDGSVTKYKDKYRVDKKGNRTLKKRKISDKKGLFGKNYSTMKKDKKGNVKRETGVFKLKKASAMKKMDPPAKQAKIKKMIIAGIEKGKDDRDILKKINSMSDGSVEYTYNRKTKQVKVRPKGASGFEGELETDPDKG
jgi:hypothetical protein